MTKFLRLCLLGVAFTKATAATASDYGREAVLCFANSAPYEPISPRKRPLAEFVTGVVAAIATAGALSPARAADGCTVLLCLAGNWQNISQCVPPVRQALRDRARGKWPTCGMVSAENAPTLIEGQCPLQYRVPAPESATPDAYSCKFTGAVESRVGGQPVSRTWWSYDEGDDSVSTVTEWFALGRQYMAAGNSPIDDTFDRDYADWLRAEEERRAQQPVREDTGG